MITEQPVYFWITEQSPSGTWYNIAEEPEPEPFNEFETL
jgi:hypothetical protein